jgi:hypothetical protein
VVPNWFHSAPVLQEQVLSGAPRKLPRGALASKLHKELKPPESRSLGALGQLVKRAQVRDLLTPADGVGCTEGLAAEVPANLEN